MELLYISANWLLGMYPKSIGNWPYVIQVTPLLLQQNLQLPKGPSGGKWIFKKDLFTQWNKFTQKLNKILVFAAAWMELRPLWWMNQAKPKGQLLQISHSFMEMTMTINISLIYGNENDYRHLTHLRKEQWLQISHSFLRNDN